MMDRQWFNQYEKHVPHSIPYPEIPIHHFLLDTVAKRPDDIAISFNEIHIPYKELNARVNLLADALQKAGVEKGDRVALLLVNSPVYVVSFFAVMKIGAVVVNLGVGVLGEELVRCLNGSDAKVMVTMDLFAPSLYKVIKNTGVKTVILYSVMGLEKKLSIEEGAPQPQLYQDILAAARNTEEPAVKVSHRDIAVLQYTSGSTGTPKAATLTHYNLVASVLQTDQWIGIENAGNAAVICVIPFFHVFGLSACCLLSVLRGYRMILIPRVDLMDILSLIKTIETYRPISFPAVPSLWGAILSLPPETARNQLFSIQVATSGGAPLPSWIHERFENLTGRKMMEAYGLSEASSATHFTPYPSGGPKGSIGVPLPDTEARIMDLETGERECAVGEIGELVVKGPQVMQGYWRNEDLTSAALRHGWFYTGDLARMDQDGFFYIMDRKDDLIISSGYNIYPNQIEDILEKHPKIREAAVIGVPDRIKGQAIFAVIVLREGMQADKEEFLKYCKENMPDYRVPKTILIRDAIPRNPAGKILKRVLRQDAQVV